MLPAGDHAGGAAVDDRADLLRRSAASLLALGGGRPLVLLVDDAHLLDDGSATLVHQLAMNDGAFLLVTVRTGEPAPDPVVALWKDGLLDRIEVGGITARAIEEVLTSALGGPVDPALVANLAVHCQGNVLFLREVVLGAFQAGSLRDDGGIWRLVGPLSPSDRLIELVEARLSHLQPAERALLELVSFGEPVGSAELTALADPSTAEALEREGLLSSRMDGRRLEIRLAHPIYGDVLRSRIPAVRARALTRSLAEVVEATGARRREDTLRVATWRLAGGGGSPQLMLAAATAARWRYDFALAERLAKAAVGAGAGFDAALLAAQLAGLQGRVADAEGQLAVLADNAADDAQRALVAMARLDDRVFYMGRLDDGLRMAEKAEAMISDPAWRDEIAARRAGILLTIEGPRASAAVAEPLLRRASGRALGWVGQPASFSLARLGRLTAALEAAERSRSAQLALDRPLEWYPWMHLFFYSEALAELGRFREADEVATGQYEQALVDRSPEAQAWFAWALARRVADRGHVDTAASHAREAAALFRQLGRPFFVRGCHIHLTFALALAGNGAEAAKALAALDAMGLFPSMNTEVDLFQARAWTAVAGGDLPEGRRYLEEAVDLGERIGDLVGAATALHSLARLGKARQVATRLADLAGNIEGDLVAARVLHARALAQGDPDGLEAVSLSFESMSADLLAAEASADAAVAWRRQGRTRESNVAELRAATLAAGCEGAVTPALQSISTRSQLTPAERETALLAATGRSNREIAEELHLSIRTVENRLQRVYEKLGVSSRGELVVALDHARLRLE
jgi:DNA-binding CsgD family transcriptional regulator